MALNGIRCMLQDIHAEDLGDFLSYIRESVSPECVARSLTTPSRVAALCALFDEAANIFARYVQVSRMQERMAQYYPANVVDECRAESQATTSKLASMEAFLRSVVEDVSRRRASPITLDEVVAFQRLVDLFMDDADHWMYLNGCADLDDKHLRRLPTPDIVARIHWMDTTAEGKEELRMIARDWLKACDEHNSKMESMFANLEGVQESLERQLEALAIRRERAHP